MVRGTPEAAELKRAEVPLPEESAKDSTLTLGSDGSIVQPGTVESLCEVKSGFSTLLDVSAQAESIWGWVAG